jgi:hypothetical protein
MLVYSPIGPHHASLALGVDTGRVGGRGWSLHIAVSKARVVTASPLCSLYQSLWFCMCSTLHLFLCVAQPQGVAVPTPLCGLVASGLSSTQFNQAVKGDVAHHFSIVCTHIECPLLAKSGCCILVTRHSLTLPSCSPVSVRCARPAWWALMKVCHSQWCSRIRTFMHGWGWALRPFEG